MKTFAILGLLLLAGLGAGGGGVFGTGDKPVPPGGGKTPTKPTGPAKPSGGKPAKPGGGPPKPVGGRTFGNGKPPAGWDPASNQFWISPDCDLILEGEKFEPVSRGQKTIKALEAPTLAETLAMDPENTVFGYIDYLMDYQGFSDAGEIAIKIMQEANALCADAFPNNTPPALTEWFESFRDRIQEYVDTTVIGFDPGKA